ncbi:MAG: DNA mismatch repair protein MutS [Deltaproteobacteria bacterium]|nr:DNA mismatch repair protein MutS [Deltaproteobacteria bacterium]
MKNPREVHEAALAEKKREAQAEDARAGVIATARLVMFVGALGLLAAVTWAHLPPGSWLGVVGLVIAFAVLVVVHSRVHAKKDRLDAAARFHERALARMGGKWRDVGAKGERFAVETHPYAGDLDVFGKASLFQLLDQTSTRFGEEVLARWLSGDDGFGSVDDEEYIASVKARQAAVKDLAPRTKVREELAVVGSLLDEEKPDPRPFVMWAGQSGGSKGQPLPSWLYGVAVVMPIVTIGTAVATAGALPRASFLAPFVASMLILASLAPRLKPVLDAASSKESALSRYAGMLAILENEKFESEALISLQKRLRESGASATVEMERLSRIVGFLDARENGAFRFIIGPMLMWDLWCALALDRWRARAGRTAFGWFRALAELEALASIAGFAFERPDHVFPDLVAGGVFEAESLGHPLIGAEKRVSNDVTLEGRGHALVVTGSNMSGKSTLLRAIGVNAVLARAGAPVCAKKLVIGRLVVATSMRVSDSLDEGTSRFYAELKKLKLVLDLSRSANEPEKAGDAKRVRGTVLFLLDEILHGTNTRERLIGARAILRELLAQSAMGAVSTHDLGLGDLETEMPGRVRNVHFEEQVANDVMTFDYKLRQGIVQSSNALRLMKLVGLDVIEPAPKA